MSSVGSVSETHVADHQLTNGDTCHEARDHDTSGDSGTEMFGSHQRLHESSPGSRLSRIFSLRRSPASEPPAFNEKTHPDNTLMRPLAEEDETMLCSGGPMAAPPSLPPTPSVMSPDQTKRRFIINSLVQSENNYLESLTRLISDYKKPLEESNPPILSEPKVATMFYRVPEILQIHSQFRIALSEAISNWDEVRHYFIITCSEWVSLMHVKVTAACLMIHENMNFVPHS